ncbi:MAG: NAD-dependent epimerase/dehydratase family protein [Haloferacaceae archaeon]
MTETVLVTGGLGRSGRWIVDRLAGEYEVVCVDLDHPGFDAMGRDGVTFRAADLTNAGEILDLTTAVDPDAVVHWAAIPVADRHAGTRVFETNSLAAYNALTAAGRVGARVVQASSDGAYGFFFMDEWTLPEELPITESHPRRPEDAYGVSKVVAEEVGSAIARRDGVSVASIRPSWIQFPGDYPCRDDGYVGSLAAGAGNYWSYVDVRDVADLVAAALADPVDGHEAFNCVAADNALGRPLVDLLEDYYGDVPAAWHDRVDGDATAFSTAKAGEALDWEPSRSWRDAATDESVPEPELTV